jgi:hypothetical protein
VLFGVEMDRDIKLCASTGDDARRNWVVHLQVVMDMETRLCINRSRRMLTKGYAFISGDECGHWDVHIRVEINVFTPH